MSPAERVVVMLPADGAPAPLPSEGLHLLKADTALSEVYEYGAVMALCGAVLHRDELPSAMCPEDCEQCDHEFLYCADCASEAVAKSVAARPASGRRTRHGRAGFGYGAGP